MVELSAIGACLVGIGSPENSVVQYKMAIKTDGDTSRPKPSDPPSHYARDVYVVGVLVGAVNKGPGGPSQC
jgi:hypothetical protein